MALAGAAPLPPPKDWKLPPVDGELSGELNALLLGGAPKLKWTLTLRTERPRERQVAFAVEGYGLKVKGDAVLDPMGDGTWRVTEAEINLAEWFGWVAPKISADLGTVSMAGTLTFLGSGSWRSGQLSGAVSASLREGRFEDVAKKLVVEGISVDVEVTDITNLRTAPAQVFTFRSGQYDVVKLGVGRIEFMIADDSVRITESLIDALGGELQVGSLVFSLSQPEFSVNARMVGVAVEEILFLLPPVLSEGKGRLDGNVALRRDSAGVQIGNGRLTLRQGETADLRLAVKPGWLSTSLPPTITKNFPAFGRMERGEIPIRARVLEITLTPAGDASGRTAWVHIIGGPSDPELSAPLEFNIAVRGPLEELVRIGAGLGTDSRLRFGSGNK